MTRVGVLSDSHLTKVTEEFRSIVSTLFRDVDMIIHAGDITSKEVYAYLCNWDVRAVRGNMDDLDLAGLLPTRRIELLEGRRIGIVHGKGPPYAVEQLAVSSFTDVDIIIFGHSHVPVSSIRGGVALFNPGALRNPSSGVRTVGLIELGKEMKFMHIPVK